MSIWVVIKSVKPLRDKASVLETKKELRVEQMLLCVEISQLLRNLIRLPSPCAHWKYSEHVQLETQRQSQMTMERLHFPSSLGTPWDSFGGAGGHYWGKSRVGC